MQRDREPEQQPAAPLLSSERGIPPRQANEARVEHVERCTSRSHEHDRPPRAGARLMHAADAIQHRFEEAETSAGGSTEYECLRASGGGTHHEAGSEALSEF